MVLIEVKYRKKLYVQGAKDDNPTLAITFPRRFNEAFGLNEGDVFELGASKDGTVITLTKVEEEETKEE